MKLVGMIGAATLSLVIGVTSPAFAQEQHDQQEQKHDDTKSAQHDENKMQQDKPAHQEEKHIQQEEKKADQEKPAQRDGQHEQQAERGGGNGRHIPDDHFRAHFGREHVFVINRPVIVEGHPRFQYGGYWFGYSQPWPGGWAYTDNVYVDFVDGGYYLYNPFHPGIRVLVVVI